MLNTSSAGGWWPQSGGDVSPTFWGKGKGHAPPGSTYQRTGYESFGHSTSKVPPYWEPSLKLKGYPFRVWLQDLDVWSAGAELADQLVAPAVAQRLGGGAAR